MEPLFVPFLLFCFSMSFSSFDEKTTHQSQPTTFNSKLAWGRHNLGPYADSEGRMYLQEHGPKGPKSRIAAHVPWLTS